MPSVISPPTIKSTAIPRAGYDFQDLVGIELLIRFFRDPDLFQWVTLESDDPETHSLDDVVALRRDGSVELIQVKFTVDDGRYPLDWDWLLGKKKRGTSLLAKWSSAFARAEALGPVHSASLRTNRVPSAEFRACLEGDRIDLSRLGPDLHARVVAECGGEAQSKRFFREFAFVTSLPDLDRLEVQLRDALIPTDTDLGGWNLLRSHVRRWSTFSGEPGPDGRIRHEHLVQLLSRRRPKPIRQDFQVPESYGPPSAEFDRAFLDRIHKRLAPITVLWGTPGRGKSTYLSYLADVLAANGLVIRHHYFLSLRESSADRTSFFDIANSLFHQIAAKAPDLSRDITGETSNLREDLARVADALAGKGKRLFIIVDGLDHVWRDTQRVDQLEHLFNVLLPLSDNISLIVGTQRVDHSQLPKRLLVQAEASDWIEIPGMDRVAVHTWVDAQDRARPLLLNPLRPSDPGEEIARIADAFWEVSHGHPLHLIYAMESLRSREVRVDVNAVKMVPPCPGGDIRDYYNSLWVTLAAPAKRTLHALAGSPFAWPPRGVRRCFGDFTSVEFLLESRPSGLMPFHGSIFAWVRERADHAEIFDALLPDIVEWLRSDAPSAWRWAWLWIMEARAGNIDPLLGGATRDWAVTSLAHGWPEVQIEEVLGEAERIAFDLGELPRTVALRSVKTRVANAREFQASEYGLFRAAAIAIAGNRQQARNLLDNLPVLDHGDLPWLARLTPAELRDEVTTACVEDLARRITAWLALRHRPGQEFVALADSFVTCALLQGEATVPRIMRFLRGFRSPAPRLTHYISGLGDRGDLGSLIRLRSELRPARWQVQRREIETQLLRAALRIGRDPRSLLNRPSRTLSPLVAAWRRLQRPQAPVVIAEPPIPEDLLRDRYFSGSEPRLEQFFVDAFWLYVCRAEAGRGPVPVYTQLDREAMGWLAEGLSALESAATSIISGESYGFSTPYEAAAELAPVQFSNKHERDYSFYTAFKRSLVRIAVDLHLVSRTGIPEKLIPLADFDAARGSLHWSDSAWISARVADQLVLLAPDAASSILDHQVQALDTRVSEFMERGAEWNELACFAHLHRVGDPPTLIRRSADCLLGYGYRKDLSAMEVLDAIAQIHPHEPARTRERLEAVTPVIDVITEFTDGDETDHVRSDLIDTVAATLPEMLPAFHRHHIEDEDWRYADECLRELLKLVDLNDPFAAGLASTLIDLSSLGVLEDRAASEPAAATLHATQLELLGGAPRIPERPQSTPPRAEKRHKRVPVGRFSPRQLPDLLAAISNQDVAFDEQRSVVKRWLEHWSGKGRAVEALTALEAQLDQLESGIIVEEALDSAYRASLAAEGKNAAFRWLVRAHVYRRGWASFWVSESEIMERLEAAATVYPERWLEYVRETSRPPPFWARRGYGFSVGQRYLVRFLLLAGQIEKAAEVTDVLVSSLLEEVQDQPVPPAKWL